MILVGRKGVSFSRYLVTLILLDVVKDWPQRTVTFDSPYVQDDI